MLFIMDKASFISNRIPKNLRYVNKYCQTSIFPLTFASWQVIINLTYKNKVVRR
nr:MAG TPA: hypothetical protein [Bacteriophage sp.]